jgi:hypothetical protein
MESIEYKFKNYTIEIENYTMEDHLLQCFTGHIRVTVLITREVFVLDDF